MVNWASVCDNSHVCSIYGEVADEYIFIFSHHQSKKKKLNY